MLNHTPRSANVFSNDLKDELITLDSIINKFSTLGILKLL
jgi:hypothetical protein